MSRASCAATSASLARAELGGTRVAGFDGPPASRVHSEHHRETAGKNAELPPQQGPGKGQAFPSGQHSPGAFGPSNGSDRIGGPWLAHEASQVRRRRGQVARRRGSVCCCGREARATTMRVTVPATYCRAMSEKNVETVRRVYEGVNARLETPRELFDPDYEFDNTELWPDLVEVLGFEAAQEAMREYWETFEAYHVELEEVIHADDGRVVARPRRRADERDRRRGVEPLLPRLDPS